MWRLEGDTATLAMDSLSGLFSMSESAHGVSALVHDGVPLRGAFMQCVADPERGEVSMGPVAERYARGADLHAIYPPASAGDVQYEMTWRALRELRSDGVGLIISARTEALAGSPCIQVASALACEELLHFRGDSDAGWKVVDENQAMSVDDGVGLFLYRLAARDLSYVEMVHPTDYCGAAISVDQKGLVRTAFRIFNRTLEKGVILRARVQGLFLKRECDVDVAEDVYQQFRESAVPLGS